jgi:hypothetical protein
MIRGLHQYPRPTLATIALIGVGFGLSFGSRIMGAFGALSAIAAVTLLAAIEARADGLGPAARRLARFTLVLLPAILLAYAVMALIWPWSVLDPLNPLRAIEYFSRFFEKPWEELFGGALIAVPDMPRSYVPTLLLLKLPEIFLLSGLLGTAGAVIAVLRRDIAANRRAILLFTVLAALLPIAVTIALRPAMYNGIRHFVLVLPPLAALGGLACSRLLEATRRSRLISLAAAAILLAGTALPVVEMIRLHPYEYTHFNRVSGGVAHARDRYMLDYWGLSFKQAARDLLNVLAERRAVKPDNRRWRIAVCGPHRSPQVELGPGFETTWDPNGADFAMMLGEFYCARFDAPLLVNIVRDGVSFARVYDIRGSSFETLLTRPGL